MLPVIARALGRECSNKEGWLAGLMDTLLAESPQVELGVAFPVSPGEEMIRGETAGVRYYGFREDTGKPENYDSGLERDMEAILGISSRGCCTVSAPSIPIRWRRCGPMAGRIIR